MPEQKATDRAEFSARTILADLASSGGDIAKAEDDSAHPEVRKCSAIILSREEHNAEMREMAAAVGFASVRTIDQPAEQDDPEHPISFFLVHHEVGDSAKHNVLRGLRTSEVLEARFAPVIAFVPDSSYELMLRHVKMGFDDVISVPDSAPMLRKRFAHQLSGTLTYFETSTYFGPDRRRMEVERRGSDRRNNPASTYRLIQFVRNTEIGVMIVTSRVAKPA